MNGNIIYFIFEAGLALSLATFGCFRGKEEELKRLRRNVPLKAKAAALTLRESAAESKTLRRIKTAKVQEEVYEGLSIVRNLLSVGEDAGLTGDMVLARLSQRGGALEPVYMRMLAALRLGKTGEAKAAACEYEDLPLLQEYVAILAEWDRTERESLHDTIVTFQKSILRSRETAVKRRDEIISDLVYIPAILNVMLVLINFVYVGYFLEQKEMLLDIFG